MNLDKTKLNYQNYKLTEAQSSSRVDFWRYLPIAICQLDENGSVNAYNEVAAGLIKKVGLIVDDLKVSDLVHHSCRNDFLQQISDSQRAGTSSVYLASDESTYLKVETAYGSENTNDYSLAILTDITSEYSNLQQLEKKLKNQSKLIYNQNSLLNLISDGKPIKNVISSAANFIEKYFDEVKVEVALIDEQKNELIEQVAPSLPKPFGEFEYALDHGQSPTIKAVRLKTAVIIDDFDEHPVYAQFQSKLMPHGLVACWATPVLDSNKEVIGVLTVYFRENRPPVFEEISLVDQVVDLLKIAIEFHLNQGQITSQNQVLSKNEMLLGKITENYPNAFILILDRGLVIRYASGQEFKNQQVEASELIGKSAEFFEYPQKDDVLTRIRSTFEGEEETFELSYDLKNYVIRTVPLSSNEGKIDSVLIAITNDTTRKEMETELREYNNSLRKLSESSLSLTGDLDHIYSITMRILIDLLDVRSIVLLRIQNQYAQVIRSNQYGDVYRPDREFPMEGCISLVLDEKEPTLIERTDGVADDAFMSYLDADRLYLFPSMNSHKEVVTMTGLVLREAVDLTKENTALVQIIGQRLAMEIEKNEVLKEKENLSKFNNSIIESLNEVTWDFYPKESKIYWFGALEKVFGAVHEEVSNDVEEFIRGVHPTDRSAVREKLFSEKAPQEKFVVEFQFEKEPEEYVWLKAEGIIHPNMINEPDRIIGVLKNIHDQKLYEINRMRAVISAKDIERKRIASEIHDSLGQTLSAARLAFDSLVDDLGDKGAYSERIDSVMGLIRNAIDESRSISHNLMPPALSDFGLITALEKMVEKMDRSSEIDFEFIHNDIEERFSEEFETNVFRIFQEAVNNIVKHSQASYATLQMIRHPGYVILTIEDDGVGFDEEKVSKGLGLKNMANRVANLGGNITVDSFEGMTITIEIVI